MNDKRDVGDVRDKRDVEGNKPERTEAIARGTAATNEASGRV